MTLGVPLPTLPFSEPTICFAAFSTSSALCFENTTFDFIVHWVSIISPFLRVGKSGQSQSTFKHCGRKLRPWVGEGLIWGNERLLVNKGDIVHRLISRHPNLAWSLEAKCVSTRKCGSQMFRSTTPISWLGADGNCNPNRLSGWGSRWQFYSQKPWRAPSWGTLV